jgi:Protein of unknown function (DUF3105)
VASRQEQKEARRRERLERERREAAAAARRKRLQLGGGVLLGLAALAGIVLAIVVGLGGDSGSDAQAPEANEQAAAQLPPQETSDMEAAAKAAGCQLTNPQFEGANHEQKEFTAADYKTNPPTSGNHTPDWYDDGVYEPETTPSLGRLVHTLEHGRINIQYKPGTPAETVAQLEALVASEDMNEGYHLLLYQNTTGMKPAVAATAWTHSLTCPRMNDKVFDAIRTFRARYIDKGPETVP